METIQDIEKRFEKIIHEELIKNNNTSFIKRTAYKIAKDVDNLVKRSKKMEDTLLEIRSQFSDTNRFQALTLQIDKILKE